MLGFWRSSLAAFHLLGSCLLGKGAYPWEWKVPVERKDDSTPSLPRRPAHPARSLAAMHAARRPVRRTTSTTTPLLAVLCSLASGKSHEATGGAAASHGR